MAAGCELAEAVSGGTELSDEVGAEAIGLGTGGLLMALVCRCR